MRMDRIWTAIFAILVVLTLALAAGSAWADEEEEKEPLVVGRWYPTLEAGVALAQSAYSDNWSGGDKGTIVWVAILNAALENQLSPKVNWKNTLKLAYGQTHKQVENDNGERSWDSPDKSTDLIDLETLFRFTLGGFVDPFASARLESQFLDASDPAGRELTLNPIKLKESAGIAKMILEEEDRSLLTRLGFTFRQGLRKQFENDAPDDATAMETTNDGGFEWITDYKTNILQERVSWTAKLSFYQPVFYSGKSDLEDLTAAQLEAAGLPDDVADYSTTMDIDFENLFTSQITDVLSVNLYTRWVYDKYDNSVKPLIAEDGSLSDAAAVRTAIRKKGQFKQTLSLGLTYRFL